MKTALLRVAMAGIAVALMHLAGCAAVRQERLQVPTPEQSTTSPTTLPKTPRAVDTPTETPPPVSQPPVVPQPAPPPNQAVVALLDTAEQRARAGNLDSAAAVVERALRLEPQNPLLWHRLAMLRLQQGQYAQAANLAAKSNALAGNNRQLQANNWETIAQAKDKLGDAAAARAARDKARALQ